MKSLLLVFLLLGSSGALISQDNKSADYFLKEEILLLPHAREIINGYDDSTRKREADYVFKRLGELLEEENSFNYPFDSLRLATISIIVSPDKKVRLFTFNHFDDSLKFKLYGYIQHKVKKRVEVFPLLDTLRNHKNNPINKELSADNWQGALYYSISTFKKKGKTHYLLLGFDGNNATSNKKVIEVLGFKKGGDPFFGAPLFPVYNQYDKFLYNANRVVFEFADKASPTVHYEAETKMVIVSHLVPVRPTMRDKFAFYVPDGTYDYYKLNRKGLWVRYQMLDKFDFGAERDVPLTPENSILPKEDGQ